MPRVSFAPAGTSPSGMPVGSTVPSRSFTAARPPWAATRSTSRKFIAGVPMKPATKRVAGRR